MQAHSPLDSAVISEGNDPNNDGNDDEQPEDKGRSHTIIIVLLHKQGIQPSFIITSKIQAKQLCSRITTYIMLAIPFN